jgi:hypothetical protein
MEQTNLNSSRSNLSGDSQDKERPVNIADFLLQSQSFLDRMQG